MGFEERVVLLFPSGAKHGLMEDIYEVYTVSINNTTKTKARTAVSSKF